MAYDGTLSVAHKAFKLGDGICFIAVASSLERLQNCLFVVFWCLINELLAAPIALPLCSFVDFRTDHDTQLLRVLKSLATP